MLIKEITEITLKNGNSNIKNFINDYIDQTQEHPFNAKARIYNGSVLEIYPFNNNIHISDIMSTAPRTGAGTAGIKFLMMLANKHNVKLELIAKAYSRDKKYITDTEQLAKWYMRLGFQIDDEYVEDPNDLEGYEQINMIYYPR